ncbi:sulfate permease [Decorospora gaudefroyi]|uniref:Sulfate permease n=1 Tax=Decorospora gaudefroyi TaxID=184978 RepID=A0A6A5KQ18_9PLEO|nr:sulfate permease [Decorospora gaudefroyi]
MKLLPTFSEDHSARTSLLKQAASDTSCDVYVEDDPSVSEWFRELVPTSQGIAEYVRDLFPSAQWVPRYNLHWLLGDAIAGITVGLVVVPQAMAYASLARLSPAFGLYTTFTGACLYWIFGTSRDIVIGTTAVGSLLIGGAVSTVEAEAPGEYSPEEVAHALSFLAGAVLFVFGILRLGFIIEFIPYIPISAFVTAASITIISTQLPTLMGVTGINTRQSPYMVYIEFFQGLPRARLDAAIGITSIVLLWLIKNFCAKMEVRQPHKRKMWSLISALRLTFTILLYTLVSWLVHRKTPAGQEKFRIVGHIEKGFSHAGVPPMNGKLFGLVAPELPAIIIILIVEHIAIAKNFGRKHNYTVIPSQEMIAQGAANMLSPFVGGYVCTGSFGASAVLSKAAVRTPLSGVFSALVLVLALYALTAVFYFIPNAALAGLIIHSTIDLIKGPKDLYKYYQLSPFELVIWICGVIIAIFVDLETSIYTTVGLSFAMVLVRMAKNSGKFGGAVQVTRVLHDNYSQVGQDAPSRSSSSFATHAPVEKAEHVTSSSRQVYIPYDTKDDHNPSIAVEPVYPGIFIYRFSEPYNYINQAQHVDYLTSYITKHTRRTIHDDGIRPADRLWCDPPPTQQLLEKTHSLPVLRAIILDFSMVNVLDITSIDGLKSLRDTLDRHAAPGVVEWHFAGVHNRWTRKALMIAGFGFPTADWCPAYTVAAEEEEPRVVKDEESGNIIPPTRNEAEGQATEASGRSEKKRWRPLYGIDRPFFHVDLTDAVDVAVRDAKKFEEREAHVGCHESRPSGLSEEV